MGVDADGFLLYGVYAKDKQFTTDESYDEDDCSNKIVFKRELLEKYNAEVVTEPYEGDWSFVGIYIFASHINDFIENLVEAKDRFRDLIEKSGFKLEEFDEPSCCIEFYFS